MASIVMSSEPCAVMTTTSVSGVSLFITVSKSIPLASGSRRSVKTRSYGEPLRNSFASPPLFAESTWWPRSLKINRNASVTLGSSSITRMRLRDMAKLLLPCGQGDANRSARAGSTTERNSAAVLLDDFFSVGHTQAEPLILGRKERLEDLFHVLITDPSTGIGDFELKLLSSSVDSDTQSAALSHGLNRIEYQIHQRAAHRRLVENCDGFL